MQFILWRGSADDATVVGAILSAARAGEGARETTTATAAEQAEITDARRPRPSVDRTALLRPTGTLKLDDRCYIKRAADESVARLAASNGETLVIKGARQMGKSSLLVRYVAACKEAEENGSRLSIFRA